MRVDRSKSRTKKSVRFSKKNNTRFIEPRGHPPLQSTVATPSPKNKVQHSRKKDMVDGQNVKSALALPGPSPYSQADHHSGRQHHSSHNPLHNPSYQPSYNPSHNPSYNPSYQPVLNDKKICDLQNHLQNQIRKESSHDPLLIIQNPLTGKDISRFGVTYWNVLYQLFPRQHPFVINEKMKYQQWKK